MTALLALVPIFFPFRAMAQVQSPLDTAGQTAPASPLRIGSDTLPLPALPDSLAPASAPRFSGSTAAYQSSPDSLEAPVVYSSRDSTVVNTRTKEIHLYGAAEVEYQSISLKANHILLNYGTNIVIAEPWPDSSGVATGKPQFSDGGQEFTAGRMRYNFKSRKGIVYETVTTQEDVYVRGGKSKFISGAVATSDSTTADVIYTEGAIFTTCAAEHPHFGIRTRKAKVIPEKLAVIGPSNLEIMGVPTPLWLPFGFFPLKSGRSSGLLFPSDWQYSPNLGFGAQGIGWFFPLGEHVNLQATADYYLKGAYRLQTNISYSRRYKYQGSFNASFSNLRREDATTLEEIRDKGITVRWNHRQDRRAHPTFNFGGNINFQTNQIDQRFINSYDVASRNVIRSSMNMTKTFPAIKSTLTAGFNHTQSNASEEITVNFPDARFQTQTFYPLRNAGGPNPRAWYKKLSFQYQSALRTEFTGPSDDYFSDSTFQAGQYGFRHQVTSALSLNVLKYFNVSPNVTYEEVYYGKTREYAVEEGSLRVREVIGEDGSITMDTTNFGDIINTLNPGVASFREFSTGVSVSTQLFGKIKFGPRGLLGLQGLRHVVKPRVSLAYSPSYVDGTDYISGTRYFLSEQDINPLSPDDETLYSPFDRQIFGGPRRGTENLSLNYSISNLLEAKVWNRKDSTSNNVKLFQNIGVSGSYNLNADSLKWSTVRMSGSTQFFKRTTRLNLSATFDPYLSERVDNRVRRVDRFVFSERRSPFQLMDFRATFSTNLTVAKIRQLFQGEEEEYVTDVRAEREERRRQETALFEETDLLSLFERFSIVHTFTLRARREVGVMEDGSDQLPFQVATNSVSLRGTLQLTENWSVNVGQIGYDFEAKNPTYPSLSIARDLHCWEMRFGWQPQRRTYQFGIAVKPGTLDFIDVPVNQNRYDRRNF